MGSGALVALMALAVVGFGCALVMLRRNRLVAALLAFAAVCVFVSSFGTWWGLEG